MRCGLWSVPRHGYLSRIRKRKDTIMKDPHIHAERTMLPGFGHAELRDFLTSATGLTSDLPKTVTCGCSKRRPFAMISKVPASVTCLACREWARNQNIEQARLARSLADWMIKDPDGFGDSKLTPATLEEQAAEHDATAAAYS
jgi:hypothetical protein